MIAAAISIPALRKHGPYGAQFDALPFTGLSSPCGVAVDSAGTVYVTDWGHDGVLKLPVR